MGRFVNLFIRIGITDNLPQGGGTFLEVGYGLGLSAKVIQSKFPKSHTIIEANADVFCRLMEENPGTIGLKGLWQDVVGHLRSGYFDGILYDPYIISEDDPAHHISFAFEAYRLLKPGGIFSVWPKILNYRYGLILGLI